MDGKRFINKIIPSLLVPLTLENENRKIFEKVMS